MSRGAKYSMTIWEFIVVVVLVIVGAASSYFIYSARRNHGLDKVVASNLSSAISATKEVYYQSGQAYRSFSYVAVEHLEAVDGYLHWTTSVSTGPSIVSYYVPPWPSKVHPEVVYIAIRSDTGSCFMALEVASHATYHLPASNEALAMGTWYSSYDGTNCKASIPASMPLSWSKNA